MNTVVQNSLPRGECRRIQVSKVKAQRVVSQRASVVATPSTYTRPLSVEERQKIANQYGYEHIGAEVPDGVTLGDVVKTIPKDCFKINEFMGLYSIALSVTSMAACIYAISVSPWYLLPLAWFIAGTAFTGWFVVGHDAGHRVFSKNKLWEDIVGTLMFAPLLYPFEPWRIKHNQHHIHTNKLVMDTAWHPPTKAEVDDMNPVLKSLVVGVLASPIKFFASIGHWLMWHFDLSLYTEKQKPRVVISLLAVAAFATLGLPAIVYYTGWMGLLKYWFMPWMGYHFWMSTFTVIHHTAPHIPFREENQWDAAKAQLSGTVHCDFPKWIEVLCHDISVHVPHHVSTGIPWYNLRKAYASLKENWGEYMTSAKWNMKLMQTIVTELHVYDEEENYEPFDKKENIPFIELQRKLL